MTRLEPKASVARRLVIVDHQSRWADEFQTIGTSLRTAVGDSVVRIDHIGSTSVPKLGAKDVIDIQITVPSLNDTKGFEQRMAAANFVKLASLQRDILVGIDDPTSPQLRKLFYREPKGTRRCHIHVREHGMQNQRYALLFRDFLRANDNVRTAYEIIKRRLADLFPDSIDGYLSIKDPLMDIIYEGAESWAATVNWSQDDLFV